MKKGPSFLILNIKIEQFLKAESEAMIYLLGRCKCILYYLIHEIYLIYLSNSGNLFDIVIHICMCMDT